MQELRWKDDGMRWHRRFIASELALLTKYFLLILAGTWLLLWLMGFALAAVFVLCIPLFLMSVMAVWWQHWDYFGYALQGNRLSVTCWNKKTNKCDQVDTLELGEAAIRRKREFDTFSVIFITVKRKGYAIYVENGSEAQRRLLEELLGPALGK
jgi:hypothetical protein